MAGIGAGAIGRPISEIRVSGNDKTQERWVLEWARIRPGDILTLPLLRRARQELLDTDLFRSVDLRAELYENGELSLHIVLHERRYWLLLPRLSRNADGDVKAGIRLRVYNLQGADRTLELMAQQEEEGDGDDSEEIRLSYRVPLYNSPYDLGWRLRHIVENTEEEDFDNVETVSQAGMAVSRDIDIDGWDVPLTVAAGVTFEERRLERPYPDSIEAREPGRFNRLNLAFIFDDLHSERYRRFGKSYTLAFSRGYEWLGSDYDTDFVEFETIHKLRLNPYDNFNLRFVVAASNDSPFDYPSFGIGGGSTLRGLEDFDERGNARMFANFEYVFAYHRHPQLRHTLFLDVGNIYENFEDLDPTDLQYTIGTGFRWKIESFVRTDLFLDYGYDPENNTGKLYGGTSLPF